MLQSIPTFLDKVYEASNGISFYALNPINFGDPRAVRRAREEGEDRMLLYFSVLTLANFFNGTYSSRTMRSIKNLLV